VPDCAGNTEHEPDSAPFAPQTLEIERDGLERLHADDLVAFM
jgi:hypothetical protein